VHQDNTGWTIQRLTEDWVENEVTYVTMPGYDATVYDTAYMMGETGSVEFDITTLVAEWVGLQYPNYGLLVTNDYLIVSEWPSLASSDHDEAAWRPRLVVEYHESGPGVQSASWGRIKGLISD